MTREYNSAAAFKQALEQRLRTASSSGVDFARRRQLIVFNRFLARVVIEFGDTMTLKGGLAVEFRIERARSTKDVDLRSTGLPDAIQDQLRSAARRDLGDFMIFTVRRDERHRDIQNDGMRFRAECTLAGKAYGRRFGVDARRSSRHLRSEVRTMFLPICPSPRRAGKRPTRTWREESSSSGRCLLRRSRPRAHSWNRSSRKSESECGMRAGGAGFSRRTLNVGRGCSPPEPARGCSRRPRARPARHEREAKEVRISKMSSGKRRPCCFNLASCTDPELARSGKLALS